jgi:all-trans-retinol 13,14-reductase
MKPSTLRIGKRYRPNRLAPSYDAIVIGSGMGGLTTAALLSELGWKVCVLEQHYTAGGYTHSFERHGYEWDPGVHYIGDVGAETRTRKMFDFVSEGNLKWAPMDAEYDRFYIGDKVYSAVAGRQEFRDNLVRSFPDEADAIDRYLKLLKKAGNATSALGTERVLPSWQRKLMWPFFRTYRQPGPDCRALRSVGRHGSAAETLGVSRACIDRATLPVRWLLPDRRQLADCQYDYPEDSESRW